MYAHVCIVQRHAIVLYHYVKNVTVMHEPICVLVFQLWQKNVPNGLVYRVLISSLAFWDMVNTIGVHCLVCLSLCLFVCLDDLPVKGNRQSSHRGYKHQAGNNRSLSYKHWLTVYDYELHKSGQFDSVTKQ